MSINQFDLLKTKRFLPLFITQFLGAMNDNIFKNALVILITYQISLHSVFNPQVLVTMAAGIFILPFFLFSATAGQLADKYERSRLIFMIKFFEVILMCLAAVGLYWQNTAYLMGVLFLIGMQATFFGPVKYAILPNQLAENELLPGNGLIEAGTFLGILVGTILGGVFILTHYGNVVVSTLLITFALLGWISSGFIPRHYSAAPELKVNYNFIQETKKVIQYTRERWDVFLTILGISWFWLVGAIFLSEFSPYAKDILSANGHVVTLFFTIFSLGIGVGSMLCNRLLKGKVHATYVPLGAFGISIFTIDLYFASQHAVGSHVIGLMGVLGFLEHFYSWRILVDLFLIAVCSGLYIVPLYAILQQRSQNTHRARVIAGNNILNALFMVVAALLTMLMLYIGISVVEVFLVIAIINTAVAVYICKLLPEVLIKSVIRWLLKIVYRVEVIGLDNYENAGDRVVIIANHTSFLDAALLAAFLPDKLTFAVNTFVVQKWWIRLFLRMVDAYPLDPTNPMALKSLINYLEQDKRCVIFPEGRITVTGTLMKIYEGPGLIADKSGAKLLPIRIEGAQYSPFSYLKNKVRIHWAPKITITVFPACDFDVPVELKGRKRRYYTSNKLYDLMTLMSFQNSPYHQQTLFMGLLNAKELHGKSHVIAEDIERKPWTYSQLIMRSFVLGNYLSDHINILEKNIGLLLPNSCATLLCFFGLHAINRVPAMINFSTGTQNILIACMTAKISTVLTSQRFIQAAKLEDLMNAIQTNNIKILYLEDLKNNIKLKHKLKGFCQSFMPKYFYRKHQVQPQSPAVILFTSGSEGTPKGVVLSHANIQANCYQLSSRVDFTSQDKVFNALPLFHSFGLTGGMFLPVLSGLKVFFYPSPLHYRVIPELSYDTNSTILFGTDTFLAGYAKSANPYDFYSIRYVFAGAEKLKEETRKIWSDKFGVRIFEGYGATEASPVLATNTPMQNRPGTVGRFLPGIEYQLQTIPGIEEGQRLFVKGPNIMSGYLHAENPGNLEPPSEGWHDTGDIVNIDEDGYIRICGRAKRFAKIGGEMISLPAIENYLEQLWPNYQHAVISIADSKKGEQLVLITTNQTALREDILAFTRSQNIPELMAPKKILFMEKLPLLGTGKTDYCAVQKIVTNGE